MPACSGPYTFARMTFLICLISDLVALVKRPLLDSLGRVNPAWHRIFMCSLVVGWLMRSLRAIRQPQTPSFTRSPSTCGGKCLVGFLSHSRICSLRSFARARIAMVDIICTISKQPNHTNTLKCALHGWSQ
jgi:hypothetical protein